MTRPATNQPRFQTTLCRTAEEVEGEKILKERSGKSIKDIYRRGLKELLEDMRTKAEC